VVGDAFTGGHGAKSALVTLVDAGVERGEVVGGQKLLGLSVHRVEDFIGRCSVPRIEPKHVHALVNVARPLDGVGGVISIDDGQVGLGDWLAEIGDVAIAVGAALASGIDTGARGPVARKLRLEGVVNRIVGQCGNSRVLDRVVVLGRRAAHGLLVNGLGMLLLIPGAAHLGDVEVSHRGRVVAHEVGSEGSKHYELLLLIYKSDLPAPLEYNLTTATELF